MDEPSTQHDQVPWPQRLFNSVWVLALVAMLYFLLSYVIWGLIDLANTGPAG